MRLWSAGQKLFCARFVFASACLCVADSHLALVCVCAGLYHLDLTSSAEKSEITVLVSAALNRLQINDRRLPQVLRVKELVRRGIGLHHAGMLPILKEVVEMVRAMTKKTVTVRTVSSSTFFFPSCADSFFLLYFILFLLSHFLFFLCRCSPVVWSRSSSPLRPSPWV